MIANARIVAGNELEFMTVEYLVEAFDFQKCLFWPAVGSTGDLPWSGVLGL